MASSSHFRLGASGKHERSAALRHGGYAGLKILRHRAFRTFALRRRNLAAAAFLALILTSAWLGARSSVGSLWGAIIERGGQRLGIEVDITMLRSESLYFGTSMPYVTVQAAMPSAPLLIVSALITLATILISLRLPGWLTPIAYLLRAFCFIHGTALFYFTFFSAYFPHDLASYIQMMLNSSMAFISAIPAIMGFTYYIFDFPLSRKLLLTVLMMAHLVVFAPLQYLIHLYVIARFSLLFMPLVYIVLGLLPQVAVFIAFYSWGMSWSNRESEGVL